MFLHSKRAAVGSARLAIATAVTAFALGGVAFAQENQTSPPSALQFPSQAPSNAQGEFSLGLMRGVLEDAVDLALCKSLMTRAGESIPIPFQRQHCLPTYAQQVAANSGDVHWAPGARPRTCGQNCLGRPMMTAEDQRNRPNLRRAQLFGRILLTIELPGPGTREVSLGYDAFFTCRAANGARTGDLVMDIRFGPPAIGGAGIVEGIVSNVFTAGELSRYVESEIRRQLPNLGSQANVIGNCRSVGTLRNADPSFDAIKWDLATGSGRVANIGAANVAAVRDQVRIEFLRIVRRPLPGLVAQEHGRPGDPASGQFTVFLNGQSHFLPAQGLVLPVAGGSAPINFCTTVDVTNWNGLQLLFTNDLGGAAWSQFASGANYGHGGVRTLTTSRTIVVPGSPGPPDPITGRPRPGGRPQTVVLNEFELTYRISFTARPTIVSSEAPAAPSRGTIRPGISVLQTRPTLATDGGAPAQPCREI